MKIFTGNVVYTEFLMKFIINNISFSTFTWTSFTWIWHVAILPVWYTVPHDACQQCIWILGLREEGCVPLLNCLGLLPPPFSHRDIHQGLWEPTKIGSFWFRNFSFILMGPLFLGCKCNWFPFWNIKSEFELNSSVISRYM